MVRRRCLVLCLLALILPIGTLNAESVPTPPPLTEADKTAIADLVTLSQHASTAADREQANTIASNAATWINATIDHAARATLNREPADPMLRIRVFVSRALPREDLAAAIALAQHDARISLVFRGFLPDSGLAEFKSWLADRLGPFARLSRVPRIEIDPPAFQRAGVDVVPVVAVYRQDTLLGQVAGLIDPEWLESALAAGRLGPYPTRGPTYAIAEADLMQLMQARARAFDWQAWQRQQREALSRSLQVQPLPKAPITRVRWHDPSFVVQETIRAQNQVIAEAGTRINPLDTLPFTQELWVIDATDPAQWQLLQQWQQARQKADPAKRITVLTTALPIEQSLKWLDSRARELGQPIQLWRADFATAFGIAVVPSQLRAEQGRFRISEFQIPSHVQGSAHADRQTSP